MRLEVRFRVLVAAAFTASWLVAGCGGHAPRPAAGSPAAGSAAAETAPSTRDRADPSSSPAPSPPGSGAATGPPPFVGEVAPVTAADLPASWRAGCPVPPEQLRRLRLSHWGFDGQAHVGMLVAHHTAAADLTTVFATLYRERFPIRLMQPVDAYGGSDDASMAADNTSAFNCRNAVNDGPPKWSQHAYGLAIDVNPVENPYLLNGRVLPPNADPYAARSPYRPGMAVPGGVLVRAFAAVRWSWGGTWGSPDYQHFSRSGG